MTALLNHVCLRASVVLARTHFSGDGAPLSRRVVLARYARDRGAYAIPTAATNGELNLNKIQHLQSWLFVSRNENSHVHVFPFVFRCTLQRSHDYYLFCCIHELIASVLMLAFSHLLAKPTFCLNTILFSTMGVTVLRFPAKTAIWLITRRFCSWFSRASVV